MMPHPAREDSVLAGGLPLMRSGQYAIEHINLKDAFPSADLVTLPIDGMVLRNFSHHAESVNTSERMAHLLELWKRKADLPASLSALITSHEESVRSGKALDISVERLVQTLQNSVTDLSQDLGIPYRTAQEDVLSDLRRALKISASPPAPPISVSEIDPNETTIKRRVVKEWKRWANSRGSASAVFRQAVRHAYRSTCVVCGQHLPVTSINASPGVDAAHILPWADYDLDVVANGLCLCKIHHWAFDEGLIGFFEENGIYRVEMLPGVSETLAEESPHFALAALIPFCGEIPANRLPPFPKDWPNPKFLQLLREGE